jgi:hypothetical protein
MGRGAGELFLCSMLTAGLLFARGTAVAEGISGSVELFDAMVDSKSKDASGLTSNAKVNQLRQRYTLFYGERLYPYLNLRVGGTFDKTISEAESDIGTSRSTETNIFPSADLTLNNPFISAGAGISRHEGTIETRGGDRVTNIQDKKTAFLGFRPEGLPSLDLQAAMYHNYDKTRKTTDSETDIYSATTRFTPVRNLDLAYAVSLSKNEDLLSGTRSDLTAQNERVSYSNRFFGNRVNFSTDYSAFQSTRETRRGTGGEVAFQLFPFAGLSSISDTPTLDVLQPNQALVDGNTTASSGINIGQGASLSGDTRLRSVGLDFGSATAMNTLYIYVDRQLPASVAGAVAWDVYVSSDNQNWTPVQTGLHGAFNSFTNRFELLFPDVTTRYVKAATRPVGVTVLPPPGTDISNIFITELQAFIRKPESQVVGKTRQTGDLFNANASVAILENQLLVYSVYYSQTVASGAPRTTFLSNSLSSTKRFNEVFSGNARVAREDALDALGKSLAYTGAVSLNAVPLPTLSHTLVVSTRTLESRGEKSRTSSLFLNNSAALYEGVSVNLSGGISYASIATGGTSQSTFLNGGASIVPNRSVSLNVNHLETQSSLPGGVINRAVSSTGDIAWSPVQTVYLAYSITESSVTNTPRQTHQSYTASWVPFSTGALNFTASYVENRSSAADSVDRVLGFGALWRMGPRILLSAGYSVAKSTSPSQSSDARSLSTNLRMSF